MGSVYSFFQEYMPDSKKPVFGLSSIFARSDNIKWHRDGTIQIIDLLQINTALLFDVERNIPVFLKPLDGSVRDVMPLKKVLQKVDFQRVLVLGRGFASYGSSVIIGSGMDFVMPPSRIQNSLITAWI